MGPSPPPPRAPPHSSQLPSSSSSSSSSLLPNLISAADDWFLNTPDRDTQIVTQALTRELSSCSRGPAPACSSSPLFPSPVTSSPSFSSSSFYETLSRCLHGRPLQSQSFEALMTLQQQQQQQQLNHVQQQQQKAAAMSSMRPCGDGFSHFDQIPQPKGSPLSSNSSPPPLSASAEAPASPFSTSTLSTSSAVSTIATETLLAHSKHENPQHHDSQDGRFARMVASPLKPSEVSSMYSDSSLSAKAASIALSSQASVGAGGCKVNKRRSRASSSKAPIAVLSADTSNFRAMVQQLTGIPSSSSIQSLNHGRIPLLKPQPIRHPLSNTLNLPTLDTSACFLGPKNMEEGFSFAQRQHQPSSSLVANLNSFAGVDLSRVEQGRNVDNTTLQSHMPPHVKQSVFNEQANGINHSRSSMLPGRWDSVDKLKARGNFSSLHEGEQQISIATTASLDNLLMEEHSGPKSSMNAVDSWLSFFEGAHASHVPNNLQEMARMA